MKVLLILVIFVAIASIGIITSSILAEEPLSPKKQVAQGIAPENVICKEGLELIIRHNGSPACVKPDTAEKLEKRSSMPLKPILKPIEVLIDSFEDCVDAGNPVMESYPRQCRTSDGKHFVESIPMQTTQYCSGGARCIIGTVTRIVDGDTIYVDGQSIRFALASAPELAESGGANAKNFVERLCPVGSSAIVDEDDGQTQGSYGRIIGLIYCNGVNLNESVLDVGHAIIDERFCSSSEFIANSWVKRHGCAPKPTYSSVPKASIEPKISVEPKLEKPSCDPSYPDVCIPSYPPDLDCDEISYKNFRVLPPDPHRFDGDKDGIGCES